MQTCYNCGKQVDDNVLICPDCGALVKRYGKPVREQDPDTAYESAARAYPGAYDAPSPAVRRTPVWLDDAGKPHFQGAICFWMIVCAVIAGYMLLGFCSMLLIYHAQDFFLDTLQSVPDLSDMLDILQAMLESVQMHYAFYVLLPVLFAGKLGCIIWFLCSKRRLAFYIWAGISAFLCLLTLVLGGSAQAVFYALDAALTFFLLRKYWQLLRR
mgnify:CR=1 FL=1